MNGQNLPTRELKLAEEIDGVFAISVVDAPAIESNFMLFNQTKPNNLIIFDLTQANPVVNLAAEEQVITGPALIPNKLILRQDVKTQEYYNVVLSAATIKQTAQKFFQQKNNTNTTLAHQANVDNTFYFESWLITDPNNDKAKALGFQDLPAGTWMVSLKVVEPELWATIKSGEFHGFSIEGYFTEVEAPKNKFANMMNKMEKFLTSFQNILKSFAVQNLKLEDGTEITWDDSTNEVMTLDTEGNSIPLSDGDYKLADGTPLKIKDGKKVDAPEQPAAAATEAEFLNITLADESVISIDETGVPRDVDGNVLADGDYPVIDGTTLTVKDGIVQAPGESTNEELSTATATEMAAIEINLQKMKSAYEFEVEQNKVLTARIIALEKEVADLGNLPAAEPTATNIISNKNFAEMSLVERTIWSMDQHLARKNQK